MGSHEKSMALTEMVLAVARDRADKEAGLLAKIFGNRVLKIYATEAPEALVLKISGERPKDLPNEDLESMIKDVFTKVNEALSEKLKEIGVRVESIGHDEQKIGEDTSDQDQKKISALEQQKARLNLQAAGLESKKINMRKLPKIDIEFDYKPEETGVSS